ncbi:uncharacterized protein BDZ83DRAFT_15935 [Colletotrichum acutatum]|uniref:Uncharacterized protein n=1 Tax=Glomerella acutata TaxID=27357 RepID=A0AAD9D0Q9_GLOAC|nr:uncharacterized protein BDZ83DRAFT_15935 [Colletotrichum acutatum]KAK1729729.1 hypothetical protein BDZ83DRAFT_15935 [Colletotrichum acutatum]
MLKTLSLATLRSMIRRAQIDNLEHALSRLIRNNIPYPIWKDCQSSLAFCLATSSQVRTLHLCSNLITARSLLLEFCLRDGLKPLAHVGSSWTNLVLHCFRCDKDVLDDGVVGHSLQVPPSCASPRLHSHTLRYTSRNTGAEAEILYLWSLEGTKGNRYP